MRYDTVGDSIDGAAFPAGPYRVLLAAFAAMCPVIGILSARGMPILLVSGVVALLAARWQRPPMPDRGVGTAFGLLILLGIASLAWSVAPDLSLKQSLQFVGLAVPGLLLIALLGGRDRPVRPMVWLPIGLAAATAMLLLDLLAGFPLYKLLHLLPADHNVAGYVHNKAATALALLLFPALLCIRCLAPGAGGERAVRRLALQCALAALTVVGVLATPSASAIVAAAGGLVVLAAASWKERPVRRLLGVLIIAAAVLTPLGGLVLPPSDNEGLEFLPYSATQRIEIWRFISGMVLEHPWLGIGLDGARHALSTAAGSIQGNLHPHNVFLQVWLELGIPGVAWLIGFILFVLRRIDRLPSTARPYADAAVAAAILVSCFAWGIWQTWWLATMLVAGALFAVWSAGPGEERSARA